MLSSDRLGIWIPGVLPPALTLADLRVPHTSIPRNPLIAEPMFLASYAEKAGSGILDMMARCRDTGLQAPEFRQTGGQFVQTVRRPLPVPTPEAPGQVAGNVAGNVAGQVTTEVRLADALKGEMTRLQLQEALGFKNAEHFRMAYLQPALDAVLIEMPLPDKPRSSRQKHRRAAAKGGPKGGDT